MCVFYLESHVNAIFNSIRVSVMRVLLTAVKPRLESRKMANFNQRREEKKASFARMVVFITSVHLSDILTVFLSPFKFARQPFTTVTPCKKPTYESSRSHRVPGGMVQASCDLLIAHLVSLGLISLAMIALASWRHSITLTSAWRSPGDCCILSGGQSCGCSECLWLSDRNYQCTARWSSQTDSIFRSNYNHYKIAVNLERAWNFKSSSKNMTPYIAAK